ncbi:family 43 glycosylhydrolase [Clostridium sp.]|uniref:family 43 glycosylhydrolase n=1 Tax=Clostridium sp. TaxID=1506 RepID=UPI0026389B91|nr:family 43 glycosylhydrolase [uncultured Clostridium sp.]
MNPILSLEYFIPDVEARQWNDGKVYLYGSKDISGDDIYCSYEYQVFYSENLNDWSTSGISFTVDGIGADGKRLYAPDCIFKNGKYYLYYCLDGGKEGVAVSDNPEGPFRNLQIIEKALGIDPSVLVDDDGEVYYFWGQVNLKGAKLKENMVEIDSDTFQDKILTEKVEGFHEGSSIRKIHGLYYLVYADISRGKATCLGYAISKSPLGPYEKKGIIIDNIGCDPETWNNHGSIQEINGKYYVFYHRSTHHSRYNRRVCIEPIQISDDGTINEVEMTSQGVEGPIDCRRKLNASAFCILGGQAYLTSYEDSKVVYNYLNNIHCNDWIGIKYYDFSNNVSQCSVEASSCGYGGSIEIHLDSLEDLLIGEIKIGCTNGNYDFKEFVCDLSQQITGTHAVYLKYIDMDGKSMKIKSICFH